jgi:hypothetical protein
MRLRGAALLALLLASPTPAFSEESTSDEQESSTDDPSEPDDALEDRVRQLEQELRTLRELLAGEEPPPDWVGQVGVPELDLAELEAALAADADALEESGATPAQPPTKARTFAASTQSLNPDISFIADVAFAWFSADEPMQSGGHDPNKNGFNLQQLELSVSKTVDPYFEFDANIVFSQFGVEIEEAYATTLGLPIGLQVRAGQFLTRFGRINNTHPHTWDFVDQSFAVGRVFGGEGNRGLGVEGSILMPFPWYFELVASETMANGASTARSFFGGDDLGVKTPVDLQTTVAIKQFFPLGADHSLFWGLSFAGGPNPTGRSSRTEVYGSDLYYKWRPVSRGGFAVVSLQAEVFWRRQQVPGDLLQDVSMYAQLFWRFAPRWAVAGRYEYGSPTTNMDGDVVADPQDPAWILARHRASANVSFWPTEFSRIRLQGSSNIARWQEQPEWALMLAFEFAVGAHGAHAF